MARQMDGRETWHRLREWDKGQTASERMAGLILRSEDFQQLDPIHPLGGQDGKKDLLCKKGDFSYVVACYFPRGQKSFSDIKNKFLQDIEGIVSNGVNGIVFITNQELALAEREQLKELLAEEQKAELYHLERLNLALNSPINYGTRLEYLSIEMTKEEQLAYMAFKDNQIEVLLKLVQSLQKR